MAGICWLDPEDLTFPPTSAALESPNGLLAAGGDLRPERLIAAYSHGIFPWYEDGQPLLWWSPDPRMVISPGQVRVSRSLRRVIRRRKYSLTADTSFAEVVMACAERRREGGGTWITGDMMAAYQRLHDVGLAHSVEAWDDQGQLAGGLYGVAIGRMFFGESMFSEKPDASKVALVSLSDQLYDWQFSLIDCQVENAHLLYMGARSLPRYDFEVALRTAVGYPSSPASWTAYFGHKGS